MMRVSVILAAVCAAFLSGCVTTPVDRHPAFHSARPRSILIVPAVNKSIDVQAPTSVLTTLPRVLGENGYYIFPVNTVKALLEFEGLYEPAEVHATPPERLAKLFGADAILYVTIHQWTAQYVFLQTTTVVDIEYRIVHHDGAELWSARKKMRHTPENSNTGSALGNILVASISAAIERADPNYLPLTHKANTEAFDTDLHTAIPPGPYATNYEQYYLKLDGEGGP